jgi:hypothetical protein
MSSDPVYEDFATTGAEIILPIIGLPDETVDAGIEGRVVNVKSFGAQGDGITDDTAAFNEAAEYLGPLGGGVIYVPAGTYIVDRVGEAAGNSDADVCIDIQHDAIRLEGAGRDATFIVKAQNDIKAHVIKIGRRIFGTNPVSGCAVRDLTVRGNRQTITGFGNNCIDVSSGCARITLERLTIYDAGYYGIGMQRDGFNHCTISDVDIYDTNADGIDWKMDVSEGARGNLVQNVSVRRFGLKSADIGIAQAGIDIRQGVSARNIHVSEYSGANTGFRVLSGSTTGNSATLENRTTGENITCIADSDVDDTRGVHLGAQGIQIVGAKCKGAKFNFWVRESDCQVTNFMSVGGVQGIYLFSGSGVNPSRNTFVNGTVTGASTDGILLNTGSATDNSFINVIAYDNASNASNVNIGSGVTRTVFLGGSIAGANGFDDAGTGTVLVGVAQQVKPATFGRATDQHVFITGDASQNLISGVSPVGNAKPLYLVADTNSTEVNIGTVAVYDVITRVGGNIRHRVTDTDVRPGGDNTQSLGISSAKWSVVYAATGTINTSDEREKQQWTEDLEPELRAWAKVQWGKYKFNDAVEKKGAKARWHFGVIAQRVKEAFESEGLDPFAYGVLCYDAWDATEGAGAVYDESGQILAAPTPATPAGDRYGVRYEEALALECALLRRASGIHP